MSAAHYLVTYRNISSMTVYVQSTLSVYVYVFFFKQKTAYEMRISDWSSDVCSSDLSRASLGSCTHSRCTRNAGTLPITQYPACRTDFSGRITQHREDRKSVV